MNASYIFMRAVCCSFGNRTAKRYFKVSDQNITKAYCCFTMCNVDLYLF